jgi:hypothetical protein
VPSDHDLLVVGQDGPAIQARATDLASGRAGFLLFAQQTDHHTVNWDLACA